METWIISERRSCLVSTVRSRSYADDRRSHLGVFYSLPVLEMFIASRVMYVVRRKVQLLRMCHGRQGQVQSTAGGPCMLRCSDKLLPQCCKQVEWVLSDSRGLHGRGMSHTGIHNCHGSIRRAWLWWSYVDRGMWTFKESYFRPCALWRGTVRALFRWWVWPRPNGNTFTLQRSNRSASSSTISNSTSRR